MLFDFFFPFFFIVINIYIYLQVIQLILPFDSLWA